MREYKINGRDKIPANNVTRKSDANCVDVESEATDAEASEGGRCLLCQIFS